MQRFRLPAILVLVAIAPLLAGGFFIELGNPSASSDIKAKNAVIVARLTGCHEPEKGALEATAEGIVDGKRQSVPLKVSVLSAPGTFAISQQWPDEGNWIVKLVAKHPVFPDGTSALVRVKGSTFERVGAKWVMRAPTTEEVEQVLASRN